jgi:8-oxo-dGTP pyrophosphatase MutT (NUDIX family)
VLNDRAISGLLRAASRFDPCAHVPFLCDGARVGWLRKAHAQRLLAWPEIFKRDAHGVSIAASLASAAARTHAFDGVIRVLYDEGSITGWRDERYAVVTAFDAPPLFHIERAAARYFGATTYAAHANGYCGEGAACEMWLARRAATKPIDPGMLDNLVGGGMSAGIPPLQTVIREAWEEAGIPESLARNAVATGTIGLLRVVPEGVQSATIFVFELELPREFQPHNEDGEVAEFRRVPLARVAEFLGSGAGMTLDASLVALDFLARRRIILRAPACG